MIEKAKIVQPVANMLKVNMGIKKGEKVLFVTDATTPEEWMTKSREELSAATSRSLLAKTAYDIAKEEFPDNEVQFYVYSSVGKHGADPGKGVEERMVSSNVVIAITTCSLSHTEPREAATKAGVRIASMPGFLPEMFLPGAPMVADYSAIARETEKLVNLLKKTGDVVVKSAGGTDLSFSIKGMNTFTDDGKLSAKSAFGNLPAGEAATMPVVGTANGKIVVEKGWFPDLTEDMTLTFKAGLVTNVKGGGAVGGKFRSLLDFTKNEEPYLSRRNCAELGIGTNPNAKRTDNILEAEKIRGTVHIAIGSNTFAGGSVQADLHQDFIMPKADLMLDGKVIMKNGKLVV